MCHLRTSTRSPCLRLMRRAWTQKCRRVMLPLLQLHPWIVRRAYWEEYVRHVSEVMHTRKHACRNALTCLVTYARTHARTYTNKHARMRTKHNKLWNSTMCFVNELCSTMDSIRKEQPTSLTHTTTGHFLAGTWGVCIGCTIRTATGVELLYGVRTWCSTPSSLCVTYQRRCWGMHGWLLLNIGCACCCHQQCKSQCNTLATPGCKLALKKLAGRTSVPGPSCPPRLRSERNQQS